METVRNIIRQVLADSNLTPKPTLKAGDYYEAYTVTTGEIITALKNRIANLQGK